MSLRKEAKGRPCTLKLPGCQPGPENEQVVLCHRRGGGMAMKTDDTEAVLGCAKCHAKLDGDMPNYDNVFDRAKKLTHAIWRRNGLI